ncbi:MAG: DUF2804 domain-containing protein [Sphaerochaetaceae bacterium]
MERTYTGFKDFAQSSRQTEIKQEQRLLDDEGRLLARGWARHNLLDYDRSLSRPRMRTKEWDFYQISDGRYMAQVNFANISFAGYASATLVDLRAGKTLASVMAPFIGGRDKYPLPSKGDVPNTLAYNIGKSTFKAVTTSTGRTLYFKLGKVECSLEMDIAPELESITTVLPFKDMPTRYFMTTKQNCMPCRGTFSYDGGSYEFRKEEAFCVMDWGRVNTPRSLVWYWGNGSTYLTGPDGKRHTFGFEITWAIGDESNATETCLFYDGKAHKIGAVDVETFPKPDKFMEKWKFISEDSRFNLTMAPFYDHRGDINLAVVRMITHQVHGLFNGTVTLDDGTVLQIKDMYAFCEYVENKW